MVYDFSISGWSEIVEFGLDIYGVNLQILVIEKKLIFHGFFIFRCPSSLNHLNIRLALILHI